MPLKWNLHEAALIIAAAYRQVSKTKTSTVGKTKQNPEIPERETIPMQAEVIRSW